MKTDESDIKRSLRELQEEVRLIKENFQSLNTKYAENLASLKQLTLTSAEAATRAANAAQRAAQSASYCAPGSF